VTSPLPPPLQRSDFFNFARAIIAAVSIHTFAVQFFDWFAAYFFDVSVATGTTFPQHTRFRAMVMVFSLLSALMFAAWLRYEADLKGKWPWFALGGYCLLVWIIESVYYLLNSAEAGAYTNSLLVVVLIAVAVLYAALWVLFKVAIENAPSRISVAWSEIRPGVPLPNELGEPVIGSPELQKVDGLILFLSRLNVPDAWKGSDVPQNESKWSYLEERLNKLPPDAGFGGTSYELLNKINWYMPLLAIEAHVTTPPVSHTLHVVLIPSADSRSPGSWQEVEKFRALVDRLKRRGNWKVDIDVLDEHKTGVSYEDLEALGRAVNRAKDYLRAMKLDGPIVIDITSGQATCSAVAAGLSFARRENIEYVSTADYSVKLYDLRYEPPCLPVNE
jgi:hypothetical protein